MSDKIITLATLTYEQAQLIKSLLNNDGIDCFLEHINLIQGAINSGVQINIKEVDFEKALTIFDVIRESHLHKKENSIIADNSNFKILVPVDFSEYSAKAINVAFDWACKLKGEVTLFNCYFSPLGSSLNFAELNLYDVTAEEFSHSLRKESEDKLEQYKANLEKKITHNNIKDVTIRTSVHRGVAEYEILNYSEVYKPSMIIMGTRGADKKAGDLIGSVTAEIIEMAKIPVLAIPERFEYNNIDDLVNFTYLSIFEEPDYLALEKLASILKPFESNIICANVTRPENKVNSNIKMNHLRSYMEKKMLKGIQYELIENENFWVGIDEFIQEKNINVLSFITYKRNIITRLLNPSTAKKMLFHSTTPLLIFHA